MQRNASEPVVDSVMLALMSVGRLMRQRFEGDRVDPGMFWLLKQLHTQGAMRITDLAGCTNLDVSTVSRHLGHLQRSGLIERTPDPADGRAQRVELSTEGRDVFRDALEKRRAVFRQSLQDWDPRDVLELERLLNTLVATIDDLSQSPLTTDLEHA